jgi:hypothetical protein
MGINSAVYRAENAAEGPRRRHALDLRFGGGCGRRNRQCDRTPSRRRLSRLERGFTARGWVTDQRHDCAGRHGGIRLRPSCRSAVSHWPAQSLNELAKKDLAKKDLAKKDFAKNDFAKNDSAENNWLRRLPTMRRQTHQTLNGWIIPRKDAHGSRRRIFELLQMATNCAGQCTRGARNSGLTKIKIMWASRCHSRFRFRYMQARE